MSSKMHCCFDDAKTEFFFSSLRVSLQSWTLEELILGCPSCFWAKRRIGWNSGSEMAALLGEMGFFWVFLLL